MLVHSLERASRESVLEEKRREMCNGSWLKQDVMWFLEQIESITKSYATIVELLTQI